MDVRSDFQIGDQFVKPGTRRTIDLPVSVFSDHTPVSLSVHVVHGRRPGPTLFVSAAVHGDEVVGVKIIRNLLRTTNLKHLKGTLLAIPIVNAFGFMNRSRYLPDRRDLNRSFPGSPTGSLGSRLAHIFMNEIVSRSDLGIDLHSAAIHRTNLPQIRISPSDKKMLKLGEIFGAPLTLTSAMRPGSLREAAGRKGVGVLLYEAGEALRFDKPSVRAGVTGIVRTMRHLGMIQSRASHRRKIETIFSKTSSWVRAPTGGLLISYKEIGERVCPGELLGVISDPFGETETKILTKMDGLLMGRTVMPIVNEGDALFHIAQIKHDIDAEKQISAHAKQVEQEAMLDEDEII